MINYTDKKFERATSRIYPYESRARICKYVRRPKLTQGFSTLKYVNKHIMYNAEGAHVK